MANLLDQLEASFSQRKVGIIEFAESREFCDRILYPRQRLLLKILCLEELTDEEERILDYWERGGANGNEMQISPYVRERMKYLKDNGYKHFREVTFVGGRRSSKGFLTGLMLAKKVYDLVQLQDPAAAYGIDPGKEIYFSCVAASLDQAADQQYADFSSMVNSCAAMQRNIHKVQELEFSVKTESDIRQMDAWKRAGRKIQRDVSKIRGKALPANSRTIRGSATMGICFDEFAHFLTGESDQSDSEVYAAAVPALAQFGRDGIIFNNSSPFSKTGKFFERFSEGMATDNGGPASPLGIAIRFPSWAFYDGWWEDPTYIGPKKCITVSPDWDYTRKKEDGSLFHTPDDREGIKIERGNERDDPIKFKVERRGHFAEVVDSYLNPASVDRMYQGRPSKDGLTYVPLRTNRTESTYMLRYKAHLDPSSTTAGFGFALGHVEEFEVEGRMEQHVIFDIIRRWDPKGFPDEVINWDTVIDEVLYIADIFRPYEITMDQHNSKYPIQTMQRELRARKISETRVWEKTATSQANWDRAETFRTALYRGLVHAPNDEADAAYSSEELKYLQEIRSGRAPRVEKQTLGPVQTKDMADCIMEVVEALIGNTIARDRREQLTESPAFGAAGGYQIGGNDLGGRVTRRPLMDRDGDSYYGRRTGEQSFGGSGKGTSRTSPTRRPVGGSPNPRKLPGW